MDKNYERIFSHLMVITVFCCLFCLPKINDQKKFNVNNFNRLTLRKIGVQMKVQKNNLMK